MLRKKKLLIVVLCMTLIFSVFTGCGQGKNASDTEATTKENKIATENTTEGADSTNSSKVSAPGVLPIVKEKVEFTAFTYTHNPRNTDLINNDFTKWLEEVTNIHVKVDSVAQQDFDVQLGLLMASGDYPEILLAPKWSRAQLMQYAKEGIVLPLIDLIEQYGHYWKQAAIDTPNLRDDVTMPDGNIYCLGRPASTAVGPKSVLYIYEPFLKALHAEVPTTTDEYYNLLKRIKEEDPNGNNLKDEIPLIGVAEKGATSDMIAGILNAFVPFGIFNDYIETIVVNDGVVSHVTFDPEFKEGIKYLNTLYKEGLMARDSFTIDKEQVTAAGAHPEHLVGTAFIEHVTQISHTLDGIEEDWVNWWPAAPLKGPKGVQFSPSIPADNYSNAQFVLTNKCKEPEIAFCLGDFLYDYDATTRQWYGSEGIGWRYLKEGVEGIGLGGGPATWEFGVGSTGKPRPEDHVNWGWIQAGPMNTSAKWYESRLVKDPITSSEYRTVTAVKLHQPYAIERKSSARGLIYPEEVMGEFTDMTNAIQLYLREMIARFVTGEVNIDSEWDNFTNQIERAGIERVIEIIQEAYNITYK